MNETREQLRISLEQLELIKSAKVVENTKEDNGEVGQLKVKLEEAASEQTCSA